MEDLHPTPPSTTTRTRALPRIAAVCVALAIGLATQTVASSAAATVDVTEPMHRTVVREAGISVAYPRSWVPLSLDARSIRAMARQLDELDPEVAERMSRELSRTMSEAVRFAAFDFTSGRPGNMIILVVDSATPQIDDVEDVTRAVEAQGVTVVHTSSRTIAGYPALRVDVRKDVVDSEGTPISVLGTQLYLPKADGTTMVQVMTTDEPGSAAFVEEILRRIRPLAGRKGR